MLFHEKEIIDMKKNELELFENICSLCVNNHQIPKTVFTGHENLTPILNPIGIHFGSLQELQNISAFQTKQK